MQRVLIIDEKPEEIINLKTILEGEYEITTAHTVKEALDYAETGRHSLILLDTAMPEMEDFKLLKDIQERVMPWHIPVLLITEGSDTEREERGLVLGAADHVVRPFYPLLLKTRVDTHVRMYQSRKKDEQQETMTDQITGVANRQRYELNRTLRWQEAVRLNVPVSICMFDLDKFRAYNEQYGYPAGDKVLASVAGAVSSKLKRSTDFFARYGGEEFIAVILGGEDSAVFEHMKKIRQAVEELQIPHGGSAFQRITVSIGGVTVVPQIGDKYDTYFEIVENMLAEAKQSGRNQVVWMNKEMDKLKEHMD